MSIIALQKKLLPTYIIVGVMAIMMSFGMLFLIPRAEAQTQAQLQAQIMQLMEQLNRLMAQLESQQGAPGELEGGFAEQVLTKGARVQTIAVLRVRSGPSTTANLVNTVPADSLGTIKGGPQYANGYTWWLVEYDNGTRGWSAQSWLAVVTTSDVSDSQPLSLTVSPVRSTVAYGETLEVSWTQRGSVPKNSKVCVNLEQLSSGLLFAIPADRQDCMKISGEEPEHSVSDVVQRMDGFDLKPGRYRAVVSIIGPENNASQKDGQTILQAKSNTFSITENRNPRPESQPLSLTVSPVRSTVTYGETLEVSWTQHGSVPKNSEVCVNLEQLSSGLLFAIPADRQDCIKISGEEPEQSVSGVIQRMDGFDLKPGRYRVVVSVLGPEKNRGQKDGQLILQEKGNTFSITENRNPRPSCTLKTDKSSYIYGDEIRFSWTSTNAQYAVFVPDTSGKDSLTLPGDKLAAQGSQVITTNVIGRPEVTLKVVGQNGQEAACTVRVTIAD